MQAFPVPESPPHDNAALRAQNVALEEENASLRNDIITLHKHLAMVVTAQDHINNMHAAHLDAINASMKKMQEAMLLAFGRMVGEARTLPDPPAPPDFNTPRRVVGKKSPLPVSTPTTGEVPGDPIEED